MRVVHTSSSPGAAACRRAGVKKRASPKSSLSPAPACFRQPTASPGNSALPPLPPPVGRQAAVSLPAVGTGHFLSLAPSAQVLMSQGGASTLRLMSDLKTVKQQPPEGVSASPLSDENIYVWGATVFGPDDTSWEGGIYTMRLMFTEQYPDKPPRVRFTSEMVSLIVGWRGPRCRGQTAGWVGRSIAAQGPGRQPFAHCSIPSPACVAVPPEHLPGRHAVLGPDPGQLVPHLQRESACDNSWHPACRSPLQRARPLLPLHAAAANFPSCSEARPLPPALPPALPPYRTERTHARTHVPPPSPPLTLAPAARLTRHDSAPPGKLHPDCDPVPPDRPELRQPGQPGGCAPLSDRHEAVLAESSESSREVGRLRSGGRSHQKKREESRRTRARVHVCNMTGFVRNLPPKRIRGPRGVQHTSTIPKFDR